LSVAFLCAPPEGGAFFIFFLPIFLFFFSLKATSKFRKLRADALTKQANKSAEWAEFKHERFLRGQSELLPLIKRAAHYEDQPVTLKRQVTTSNKSDSSTRKQLTELVELVESLLLERSGGPAAAVPLSVLTASEALSKQRRLSQCAFDVSPVIEHDEAELLEEIPMQDCGKKRAAPRKVRKDPSVAPIFLQNTFQMVDTVRLISCDRTRLLLIFERWTLSAIFLSSLQSNAEIVSWSATGDTFMVKDLENFCDLVRLLCSCHFKLMLFLLLFLPPHPLLSC
jgi:hypothetical protein